MKATSVKLPDAEVQLTVEASPEEMSEAREAAYRSLAPRTAVPGFRPGKAPRSMIEQQIGQQRLLNEALDELLPSLYRKALEQEDIHPFDEGNVELEQRDPVVLKIRIPVLPTVTLGDYRSIRLPKEPVSVDETEVDGVLADMREEHAEWVPAEESRAVRLGDRVVLDVAGTVDGEQFVARDGAEVVVSEERGFIVPGLASELVGAKPEDERRVSLALPETFSVERLRGKQAEFVLKVHDIKEKRLPELDDEFARENGRAQSLAELRGLVADGLKSAKEHEEQDRFEAAVIAAAADMSQMDFPLVMVEEEIDRQVERSGERLRQSGVDLETYLRITHKSMEDLRTELRPEARQRVRSRLVLAQIALAEGLGAEPSEIDQEIDRISLTAGPESADLRKRLQNDRSRQGVAAMLVERKALDRLSEFALGTAPAAGDAQATEGAR